MSFSNLYYRRTTGTAKACYVCYKPTTTVLATINTVDFLYTCPGHLTDPGFATIVNDEIKPTPAGVSAEEIARVKAEWEQKQKKKLEKEKEKEEREKEKEKDKDTDKDNKDTDTKGKDSKKDDSKSPSIISPTSPTPKPAHERYILHRDFFTMRQTEHRRRRQTSQAKELAPRLPGAPRGDL